MLTVCYNYLWSLSLLPPCRDRYERTPLHLAAMKGHAEMVALLIEADASLEAKDTRNVSDWVVMVECTIHIYIHERQARELHMARKRRE